jgi:hypothetical protein
VGGEPDVREALDVLDQLVEQGDPRVPADAEGVHDEQEAAADPVRAVELGLPDLQHLRRRGQPGHVREEAEKEVRRVVELPADRKLHELAQCPAGDRHGRPVGLVVPEEARVVGEPELLEQVGGVRPERERRRPVAPRRALEGLLEAGDPALHQLALLLDRQLEDALVEVTVIADLVPPARCDLGAGVGVLVGDLRRNHERRGNLVLVEERVDPRQRRADVVVTA